MKSDQDLTFSSLNWGEKCLPCVNLICLKNNFLFPVKWDLYSSSTSLQVPHYYYCWWNRFKSAQMRARTMKHVYALCYNLFFLFLLFLKCYHEEYVLYSFQYSEQYRFTHFGLCGAAAKNHLLNTKVKKWIYKNRNRFRGENNCMKWKIELMMLLPIHPRHVNNFET